MSCRLPEYYGATVLKHQRFLEAYRATDLKSRGLFENCRETALTFRRHTEDYSATDIVPITASQLRGPFRHSEYYASSDNKCRSFSGVYGALS